MAIRRRGERRIFFPWEGRTGVRRWLAKGRVRAVLWLGGILTLLMVITLRERHAAGVRETRSSLLDAHAAAEAWFAEHPGQCPGSLEEVAGFVGRPLPRDAWGNPLRLICPGLGPDATYELVSDGPDGKPGGLDRIQ